MRKHRRSRRAALPNPQGQDLAPFGNGGREGAVMRTSKRREGKRRFDATQECGSSPPARGTKEYTAWTQACKKRKHVGLQPRCVH